MSRLGSWYVLCRRARLVALTDIAPKLAQLQHVRIAPEPDYMELVVDDPLTGNTVTVEVFVDNEPHVIEESREFARELGDRPDKDAIAAADVRYAIIWELDSSDESYNVRAIVAEVLARATAGVVYDLIEGRVVWSAIVDGA